MIRVDIFYKDNLILGFVIMGHAGMAEEGEDIVCAGVSAVAQTALLGLDAHLNIKPKWKIEDDGLMECWLDRDIPDGEQEKAQVVLRTMELGLQNIQENYQQFLKVCKRRCS